LRFEVGCDPESIEFKEYWSRNGYDGNLDHLMNVVVKDPSQLIVWRENDKIVGHAIWHESNTEEHRKGGSPRNRDDREALEKLLGGKRSFVELHEWWLIKNYRGKDYGNDFLDFFEDYMKSKGYVDLVFYADHPAGLAAFRKHGYKEGGYVEGSKEYVFCHSLEQNP
jgi:ribosomal protein S18 acetylase RimI-like enzyme